MIASQLFLQSSPMQYFMPASTYQKGELLQAREWNKKLVLQTPLAFPSHIIFTTLLFFSPDKNKRLASILQISQNLLQMRCRQKVPMIQGYTSELLAFLFSQKLVLAHSNPFLHSTVLGFALRACESLLKCVFRGWPIAHLLQRFVDSKVFDGL